jgi:Ribonuclease G/E
MKGRVIHLDSFRGRPVAVLVVDGQIEELLIDPEGDTPLPGAIYRAVADRPVKGLGGMFVKLPSGQGFLRQTDGLAPGQRVIVQVSGPAEDGKAWPVTTRLLFKGRHAIVTPGAAGVNLSRQIPEGARRDHLQALADAAMAGAAEGHGLILRSAASEAEDDAVAADIAAMRDLAAAVTGDLSGGPELLVEGAGAQETAWRDWSDPAPDEVVEGGLVSHGILDQVQALASPRVELAGGGHLMIEPTRALIAIDVNTGPDTSPAAALKVNIAAARALPRQLRLRGLGGQVVVDFAPLPKRDRAILDQVLRAAFKGEARETTLAGWTALGLYELTRRRDRLPLAELLA